MKQPGSDMTGQHGAGQQRSRRRSLPPVRWKHPALANHSRRARRRLFWAVLLTITSLQGCRAVGPRTTLSVDEKLARVGLRRISESEAALPPSERGRYVPCRVAASAPRAALKPHYAGYLIVGVHAEAAGSADEILAALKNWQPGETLSLRVRRNPYLGPEAEFWEMDVQMR